MLPGSLHGWLSQSRGYWSASEVTGRLVAEMLGRLLVNAWLSKYCLQSTGRLLRPAGFCYCCLSSVCAIWTSLAAFAGSWQDHWPQANSQTLCS